jgi:hypothetical protein
MASWNLNNLACLNTWSTLFIMKQSQKAFANSGEVKMKDLLFYNPALSPQLLKAEAKRLAIDLDQAFINTCFANYDTGITKTKAIENMTNMLLIANKTMAHLAEKIDVDYQF